MISDVHESVDLAVAVEPPVQEPVQEPIHHATCTWGVVIFVLTGLCTALMFAIFIVLVVRVLM